MGVGRQGAGVAPDVAVKLFSGAAVRDAAVHLLGHVHEHLRPGLDVMFSGIDVAPYQCYV